MFGISSLPAQALEALAGLSRFSQVLLCVHNPCRHHWADIVADKDLLRNEYKRQARKAGMPVTIDPQTLHQHAHPLLAAWGRPGASGQEWLLAHPDCDTGFVRLLRLDVTADNAASRELLSRYKVPGPPTFIWIGADGEERRSQRITGEVDAETFLQGWSTTRDAN